MKFEPLPFYKPKSDPSGCFAAILSPDGWENPSYEHLKGKFISSAEISEFTKLVHYIFKECSTQNAMMKYFNKHGTMTNNVASSVFFRGDKLEYVATAAGYSLTINSYRKEEA